MTHVVRVHYVLPPQCMQPTDIYSTFQTNSTLTCLDISWNGFHLDGCKAVRSMLAKNQSLQQLNLSCNRLDKECLNELIKGLCKNSTLQKLEVGVGNAVCFCNA
jgi:hypothetical protein